MLYGGADANFNVHPDTPPPLRYAVEACSNLEIIQALVDFNATPFLQTKLNSPIQFVMSLLMPCEDATEREHWQWILELFEEED